MASDATLIALAATQFGAAILTLLLILRIAFILGANPIGELGQELVYLRIREMRQPALILFVALLFELVEFSTPLLEQRGILREPERILPYLNALQAVLVLLSTLIALLIVRRYTHRALDRRIRESMETLAYLEGQRRRRRSPDARRDWSHDEDE